MYKRKQIDGAKPWEGFMTPFKILKNLSFIGCYQSSSHLVDTGDGLVIIDTGYLNSFYTLVNGIYNLGYKPEDIKYIIHTHWHGDHTEGTKPLLSIAKNAKTIIGIRDDKFVKENEYFEPDIVVKDGDIITLGDIEFKFLETPGHTVGTISIFFNIKDEGNIYRVGMFGGAGANSLVPEFATYYQGAIKDYKSSIDKLRKEKVDLFIGNHVWNNDTENKYYQMINVPKTNPFIDNKEFYRFLDFCKERVESL